MTKDDLQETIKETIMKYKKIISGADTPVWTECLNELQKQQVFDEVVYRKKLLEITASMLTWDNIVVDDEMMIDKRTGEVLGPGVDYTCYKEKF